MALVLIWRPRSRNSSHTSGVNSSMHSRRPWSNPLTPRNAFCIWALAKAALEADMNSCVFTSAISACLIQQLRKVHGSHGSTASAQASTNMHQATHVAADQPFRPSGQYIGHLVLKHTLRDM